MSKILMWLKEKGLLVVIVVAIMTAAFSVLAYFAKRAIERSAEFEQVRLLKERLEVLKLETELSTDTSRQLPQIEPGVPFSLTFYRIVAIHAGNEALLGDRLLNIFSVTPDYEPPDYNELVQSLEAARWTFHSTYDKLVDANLKHPHMEWLAGYAKVIPRPKKDRLP